MKQSLGNFKTAPASVAQIIQRVSANGTTSVAHCVFSPHCFCTLLYLRCLHSVCIFCCDRMDWAWKVKVAAIKDCPGVITTASANGDLSYTIPTGVLMLSQDVRIFQRFYFNTAISH